MLPNLTSIFRITETTSPSARKDLGENLSDSRQLTTSHHAHNSNNRHQASRSLSSDTKHRTVYHQTPSIAQSIIRHQASHSLSSDTKHRAVYHQTPSIAQPIIRHQASHSLSSDTNQPTPITLSIHKSSSAS